MNISTFFFLIVQGGDHVPISEKNTGEYVNLKKLRPLICICICALTTDSDPGVIFYADPCGSRSKNTGFNLQFMRRLNHFVPNYNLSTVNAGKIATGFDFRYCFLKKAPITNFFWYRT